MQPLRPLLVPQGSPRAQLGLPTETRSRQGSCNRWLLPAASCLSRADGPPPHTLSALLPRLRGPKPRRLSRPCAQIPPLCLLASSPGPSRWLRDFTGRNTPPLAPSRLPSSPFLTSPSSLAHSPHTPKINHTTFAQPGARKLPRLARIPPFSREGPWSIALQEELQRSPPAPGGLYSRFIFCPWAERGFHQQRPHQLKHHPLP